MLITVHGTPPDQGSRTNQLAFARALYAGLLLAEVIVLVRSGASALTHHLFAIAALTAVGVCGQFASHEIRTRLTRYHFDMDVGLMLVALVLAGPVAGVLVVAIPELIFHARSRKAVWKLWAIANWVSFAAMSLAGEAVLHALPAAGTLEAPRVFAAGVAMVLASYVFARLLLAVAREGARPLTLLRNELLGTLPAELAAIAIGVVSAVVMPEVGIVALVGFAALVYLPQLVATQLLRAPSVARLTVDDAASVYRNALADEVRMDRDARRELHAVDALVQSRPIGELPDNPLGLMNRALVVMICTERPPTQKHFKAPLAAQIVLVSRRWAELTARCTPALSHAEAMAELRGSSLAQDATLALIAASRIAKREQMLTEHIAGVPRLHRLPLPRYVRRGLLPDTLAMLTD